MKRFFLLALLLASFPAAAQLYKWVDQNGRVQYTDKPPAGGNAEIVKSHIGSVQSGTSGQPQSVAEQEQAFRKRQAEARENSKKEEALAERDQQMREACANARSRIAGMNAGGRQVRFEPNGERHYLDDGEVQQAKGRAEQDAAKYCK